MDPNIRADMAAAIHMLRSRHPSVYSHELAQAALDQLMTSRPDVAALLRGEAVAVPKRDAEWAASMLEAMATQLLTFGKEPSVNWVPLASRLRAMLAASPFAKESNDGP